MGSLSVNRSSIPLILALLLLASGTLLLVENVSGRSAWPAVVPYWPVLLLVMGFWAVARGLVSQKSGAPASPWLWVGETVFALLIIAVGLAANFLISTKWDFSVLEPPLVTASTTTARTIAFSGGRLGVEGHAGNIKVIASDRRDVRLTLKRTARGATLTSARKRLSGPVLLPAVERGADELTLRLPPRPYSGLVHEFPQLTLAVPRGTSVRLRAVGSISVEGVRRAVRVESDLGRIAIRHVDGPVRVSTELGAIHLQDIRGPVWAHTEAGHVSAADIHGRVDLASEMGRVELVNPRGKVSVGTELGQVNVSTDRQPRGDWRLRTDMGHVSVRLPGRARFRLDAATDMGALDGSFIRRAVNRHFAGARIQKSFNGGGPLIYARAGGGAITVDANRW